MCLINCLLLFLVSSISSLCIWIVMKRHHWSHDKEYRLWELVECLTEYCYVSMKSWSQKSSTFFPSWFCSDPQAWKPQPYLSLFCPAVGCQHLYLPIRNNLGAESSLGLWADPRSWGPALSITIDSKTKPGHSITLEFGHSQITEAFWFCSLAARWN